MTTIFCLRVIRLEGLVWRHSRVPDLYVEANLAGVTKRTRTVKKSSSPVWNEQLVYTSDSLRDHGTFQIYVKYDSSWSTNPGVGSITPRPHRTHFALYNLYSLSSSERATTGSVGIIVLRLGVTDATEGADISIKAASEDIRKSKIPRLEGASDVSELIHDQESQLSDQRSLYCAVGSLSEKLNVFQKTIDVLSETHPFASIVWSLTSALYTAVRNVVESDERLMHLVYAMGTSFTFVHDDQSLQNKTASLQQPITGLLKQTIECCLFIRQYTSRSFLRRMLDTDSAQKIDEFERSLYSFKQQIDSGAVLHTAFISIRKAEEIDDLFLYQ